MSKSKKLDDKGRCCGRKPIVYKRPPHLFCHRCCAAFHPDNGEQIPNWAYKKVHDGFMMNFAEARRRTMSDIVSLGHGRELP